MFVNNQVFNLPAKDRFLDYLAGDRIAGQFRSLTYSVLIPAIALGVFLLLWSIGASQVKTSLGVLPGPVKVFEQTQNLYQEHRAERAKEAEFYERMQERIDKAVAAGKSQERIDRMREVVAQLKDRYRRLVELRYFEEKSYEEISEELNLPLGTVKAQLFRARDMMAKVLESSRETI